MEIQKDNIKDKGVSNIPYNPDLFHNDRDFYLAYRKIEHIVAAVFLVSGLIEQDDLTKNSIRGHSIECLSKIVGLIGKQSISITELQLVAAHVLHLSSLLDIGFWSGQISQMNLSLIQKEITVTYQTLNDLSLKYKNTFYIGQSFFRTDSEILATTHNRQDIEQKDMGQSNSDTVQKRQIKKTFVPNQNSMESSPDISKDIIFQAQKFQKIETSSTIQKGQRRESILALLREKNNLSVKDFVAVVSEFSEKTIQRELLSLVQEGIIRKEGDRRWSTYSLVG